MLNSDAIIEQTRAWAQRVVIGLNLCPFAKAVFAKDQVRIVVSDARDVDALAQTLEAELRALDAADPQQINTTLIVVPQGFDDFFSFNDFLHEADAMNEQLGFDGVFQVASFHPRFQFEGTAPTDVSNLTNWAPYPTLHLLREDAVSQAVDAFPDAELIYEKNIETVESLSAAQRAFLFRVDA